MTRQRVLEVIAGAALAVSLLVPPAEDGSVYEKPTGGTAGS